MEWKQVGFNALEGALMGAFVGSVISIVVAAIIWCLRTGLFMGLPASRDIAFCLQMGMLEGAAAGAVLALIEYVHYRNRCLAPRLYDQLDE